jgi:integrase
LKESAARAGFFGADQFASVLSRLPDYLQAPLEWWRVHSEVLPLEWRHINFTTGEIRLDPGTTKNGEPRVFPMTTDLRRLLDEQHAKHLDLKKQGTIEPWVFFRRSRGARRRQEAASHPSVREAVAAGVQGGCCPGRIPHDLRRTAVRNLVRLGVPERVAMQLTGHKTRSVFERYNIVSDDDLWAAAAKLNVAPSVRTQQA